MWLTRVHGSVRFTVRYSFTFAMTYLTALCANEVEEFRYRFVDGEVGRIEKRLASGILG